jgi:hypothetical protein
MKKTFPLAIEGRHPDRVIDALKHELRKYVRRERRRPLPAGVDYLDFDCRFGTDQALAEPAHLSALGALIDAAARDGAAQVYVEILARPGHRQARPLPARAEAGP